MTPDTLAGKAVSPAWLSGFLLAELPPLFDISCSLTLIHRVSDPLMITVHGMCLFGSPDPTPAKAHPLNFSFHFSVVSTISGLQTGPLFSFLAIFRRRYVSWTTIRKSVVLPFPFPAIGNVPSPPHPLMKTLRWHPVHHTGCHESDFSSPKNGYHRQSLL